MELPVHHINNSNPCLDSLLTVKELPPNRVGRKIVLFAIEERKPGDFDIIYFKFNFQ